MTVKSRPGGRSARTKAAAFDAAAALLAERGHEAIAMTDIAERAGVAATSLYRRWGDVRTLLMEVAVERLTREQPLPDTGTLNGDLRAWARNIAANLGGPEGSSFFHTLIATASPAGGEGPSRLVAFSSRIEQIAAMLERARQKGQTQLVVTDILDHLLAPLYVRTLFGMPIDTAFADSLADRLTGPP